MNSFELVVLDDLKLRSFICLRSRINDHFLLNDAYTVTAIGHKINNKHKYT